MAKTRKQRENNLKLAQDGLVILALLLGVLAWGSTKNLLTGVFAFLLVAVCGAMLLGVQGTLRIRRRSCSTLEDIDDGSWEDFEAYLEALFTAQGYKARLTRNGADFGADVILEREGERTVVQAKHWRNREVGVGAVQAVCAAKGHYDADEAMVVTTGSFTQYAIQLARENDVELWDRHRLAKELAAAKPESRGFLSVLDRQLGGVPREPDEAPAAPECPRCGASMVRRTSRYGPFWGCPGFPDCRGTRPI